MKQCILVRKDLKMDKGKLAAQCSHAAVEAVLKSDKRKISVWELQGMKKVILKVDNLRELKKYQRLAQKQGLVTALIKDAGRTFFKKPTITCLGIGPDSEEKIDKVTKELKIL
jgi:PTH2 family peptidyl-tRNA hydrolase